MTNAEKIAVVLARARQIDPADFSKGGAAALAFALRAAHDGAGGIMISIGVEREPVDGAAVAVACTHIVYEAPDLTHWDIDGADATERHKKAVRANRDCAPQAPDGPGALNPMAPNQLYWFPMNYSSQLLCKWMEFRKGF